MTPVPPPASPCLRVRLDYVQADSSEAGSRFFLSYTGSGPTGPDLTTLAGDIATSWGNRIGPLTNDNVALAEVDCLDIATDTGLTGSWSGHETGSAAGNQMPAQCAVNVEYNIARRYRGGKPRIFWPPTVTANMVSAGEYNPATVAAYTTATNSFFADIAAFALASIGTLAHVSLSYYKGFTNITNSSGRERAVPTYRAAALLDPVTGYATKAVIGSQRRRRTATTY